MTSTEDSQSAATKRRIVDAATHEFAEHGFVGARINRIAAAASANKQLIYRYFGSKQGLYEAVLIEMTKTSRALLARERESGSTYLAFLAAHEFGVDHNARFPLWARILGWEGMTDASESGNVEELRRTNFRARSEWIRDDQRRGALPSQYPAELLHALLMAASTFPVTMPRTFTMILDKSVIAEEDLEQWRTFIKQLAEALSSAQRTV
jgi:AcrR family transcriptional regulator